MAFQYYDIKNTEPHENEVFLFDANVWIFYHDQTNVRSRGKPYTRFLNKLLHAEKDPIVILPASVLSEVMNFLLKFVYQPKFLKSEEGKKKIVASGLPEQDFYKKLYRPDLQYKRDRDTIYNRIFSYTSDLRLVEDRFDLVELLDLTTAATDLDFTDWQIYKLAEANDRATIVTDDGDFVLENYPIITNNHDLLKLM